MLLLRVNLRCAARDCDVSRITLAAIFNQKAQQALNGVVGRRVDDRTPLAACYHKIGVGQLREVERQRRRRNIQSLPNRTCGEAIRSLPHQELKNIETGVLGQSPKRLERVYLFHISIIMELWKRIKSGREIY